MQKLNNFLLNKCHNKGSVSGISVRSGTSGASLFNYYASTRLQPASNLKILTAVAALRKLGPEYTFQTELHLGGKVVEETCHGNVYLVGKGDPTLQEKDYKQFVASLKERGIKNISGDFILDDSWYDDIRWSDDLIWADQQYGYGSEVSALTLAPDTDYDTNAIKLIITPEKLHTTPKIEILPHTEGITVTNDAVTTEEADEEALIVRRNNSANHFFISGKIGRKEGKQEVYMAIKHIENYIADTIRQILKKEGIALEGRIKKGKLQGDAACIYHKQSPPLTGIIIPFMKLSNNGIGEMLTKELGRKTYDDGSWESGLAAVKEALATYSINLDTIQLKDGSGISAANFIPAEELTRLLYEIQQEKWFPEFLASLPAAGEADKMIGGTLRERMKGLDVQAKTGTIEGVSTLSGYVTNGKGERLIFSILFNHLLDTDTGKELEDELVAIMAEIEEWC
ncbi:MULTISPECIES: D-alanyl-D-alanine carboxypeptidase/D-alanyl-D-alanine endopeptidase [Oceanobacillus]|uniref:D-alanyl-D-alanine carboxypeptidase/D-alanyl-D-alanine-endopeptidase n=1 Tax=Oceanobacillus aidingensis TaxID=645964 RepID=A0ABV9K5P9_9BACI|nr:D-alanyl-D-alanine carboxypeptidase/D-alanyl-D-alanine-endopeptidase [Oceanobacillus oncorhynchi]MDM8100556.1 D-alanyl-D-alanine carboxypeptidase/D-alanyl-D-alanine-endopeptidase [Oceanobacillus oncorhynchi]